MPDMVFDPEGIHRAVLNVVTNAIDAVAETDPPRPGDLVRRGSSPSRNVVQIEIRDTGPGIAADQMDKLFSPFFSTKKSRGTGLGLPVSQKILPRARRQDHRRKPAGPRGLLHAGVPRGESRNEDTSFESAGGVNCKKWGGHNPTMPYGSTSPRFRGLKTLRSSCGQSPAEQPVQCTLRDTASSAF